MNASLSLVERLRALAAEIDEDWAADNQPVSQGGPRADGDPVSAKSINTPAEAAAHIEARAAEIDALRHDLERSMARENEYLNGSQAARIEVLEKALKRARPIVEEAVIAGIFPATDMSDRLALDAIDDALASSVLDELRGEKP